MTMLVLGALGGVYLGLHRQQQERASAQEAQLSVEDGLAALDPAKLYAAEAETDSAVQAAQAKADAAATAAQKAAEKADELARRTQSASRSDTRPESFGPVPASCNAYTGNKAIGCALMLQWGYKLDQMPCLEKMWDKESHWRTAAENTSSGAYGIPQALPGDKMATYGSDWRTNPVPQIKWGLDYIKNRYDTPCGAWSFWLAHNWY